MKNTKKLIITAIVCALYATLTLALYPISFGMVQFRISEALCVLALFFPEAIVGLSLGCLISNILSTAGPLDMLFGTVATALSLTVCYFISKKTDNTFIRLLSLVLVVSVINALLVPVSFIIIGANDVSYFVFAVSVFVGEAVVLTALGTPLYFAVKKHIERKNNNR